MNDITVEDLNKIFVDGACLKSTDNSGEVPLANEKATDENEGSGTADQIAPYGGSLSRLSLARIQSLVSMTTPRYGFQMGMMAILHLLSLISLLTALGASSFQVFPQNI